MRRPRTENDASNKHKKRLIFVHVTAAKSRFTSLTTLVKAAHGPDGVGGGGQAHVAHEAGPPRLLGLTALPAEVGGLTSLTTLYLGLLRPDGAAGPLTIKGLSVYGRS